MVRRRNIFDFASKELSSTAFWAWILDSEQSDDVSLNALNADLRLKLGVPADAALGAIELEKNPDDPGLQLELPSQTEGRDDRKRIDILATYRTFDGSFLRLVIENKVRRDPNVIEQVTDYRDRLAKRVSGSVRAVVLTFDNSVVSSRLAADDSVVTLTLSDMLALLDRHAATNVIVDDYRVFLRDKQTVNGASPVRGLGYDYPENLQRWSVEATRRGIKPLLDAYLASAEKHGFAITPSKGRSIFLTMGNKSPLVSMHPSKSSAISGLWFGVSVTNYSRVKGVHVSRADMPDGFAWKEEVQSGNEWRFGYLSMERIEPTIRALSDTISAR